MRKIDGAYVSNNTVDFLQLTATVSNKVNNAYTQANSSYDQANLAYTAANSASSTANSAGLPTANIQSAASINAIKSNHYFLFNSAATTVTLPGSPTTGDAVWITVCNGLANNVIGRNALKIMGLAEDMTINAANTTVQLRYANTAAGWILT